MSVRCEETQQQTLSLRISDRLRSRIEQLRSVLSASREAPVSISDAAKTLLESEAAKNEKFQILSAPTASMARILDKGSRGRYITQSEWFLLAHFIQSGITWPNVSFEYHATGAESAAGLVRAFQDVYHFRLRTSGPNPDKDAYYVKKLDCLGSVVYHDDLLACGPEPSQDKASLPERVQVALEQLAEYFEKPSGDIGGVADMVARCLVVILDQETHNEVLLDQVLRPHWNVLWRLAARGHYCHYKQPVRDFNPARIFGKSNVVSESFTEGHFTLLIQAVEGRLHLELSYQPPDSLKFSYPVREYPAAAELRSIIAQLPEIPKFRNGNHIMATRAEDSSERFWIIDKASGFGFKVGPEEIATLKHVFGEAWKNTAVHSLLEEMALVYGEF